MKSVKTFAYLRHTSSGFWFLRPSKRDYFTQAEFKQIKLEYAGKRAVREHELEQRIRSVELLPL